jgi:cytochrome c oxidase subunit IV
MSDHAAHPTPAQYWKIAVVLAILTAIEVGLYYVDQELELGALNAGLLLVLAVAKFIIVVGWFMHLRFENPLLNRFFTGGFILAFSLYAIVLGLLGVLVIRGG